MSATAGCRRMNAAASSISQTIESCAARTVAGKDTRTVVTALIKQAKMLPKELYKSSTWDRGKELTAHRRFTLATNIDV
jgi:IS30 family transposase